MAKLLIFDWDGTLCDSLSKIVTCVGLASGEQGLSLSSPDEAREVIGLGLTESFQTLFPQATHQQVMLMGTIHLLRFLVVKVVKRRINKFQLIVLDTPF